MTDKYWCRLWSALERNNDFCWNEYVKPFIVQLDQEERIFRMRCHVYVSFWHECHGFLEGLSVCSRIVLSLSPSLMLKSHLSRCMCVSVWVHQTAREPTQCVSLIRASWTGRKENIWSPPSYSALRTRSPSRLFSSLVFISRFLSFSWFCLWGEPCQRRLRKTAKEQRVKEVKDRNDMLLGQILCGGFEPWCGVCFSVCVNVCQLICLSVFWSSLGGSTKH